MKDIPLKDYRATHFLVSLVRAHLQGWYTRDHILLRAGHPDADEGKLAALGRVIDTANAWNEAVRPGRTPFIGDDGTVTRPDLVEDVCRVLNWLFDQHAKMNGRLNEILDDPVPLSERQRDFQYIVACMGWVHYAVHHQVHGDLHFAERFNDLELLQAREGQAEESQKELDFIGYMSNAFSDTNTYNAKTCADLASLMENLMNREMKDTVSRLDYYLRIFGR